MKRGGARPGAGRKRLPRPERVTGLAEATRLIAALNQKPAAHESEEIKGWRKLWDAEEARIRLDTRRYLYDKRDGKAVQPIAAAHTGQIQMIWDIPAGLASRKDAPR